MIFNFLILISFFFHFLNNEEAYDSLLLSLELPSYIVVSNRKLVNILFPFSFNTSTTFMAHNNNNIDMVINTSRSKLVKSSVNISRNLLAYSSIFSISYMERMEAQNNNLFWVNQVDELKYSQRFLLSYATPKEGEVNTCNEAIIFINMSNLYEEGVNNCSMNTYNPQRLEASTIPYEVN